MKASVVVMAVPLLGSTTSLVLTMRRVSIKSRLEADGTGIATKIVAIMKTMANFF
ncbi:hypothetical protein ACR6HW_12100 [Fusibacter sp. JL298sf-3]